MSKVTIAAQPAQLANGEVNPNAGLVVTPNANNATFGSMRVQQVGIVTMEKGFLNVSNRSAFINGRMEVFEAKDYKEGMVLPGKIVKMEFTEPQFEGQRPVVYPSTNPNAGEPVLKNGAPYYISYEYTANEAAHDVLIPTSTVVETAEAGM